MTINDLIGIHDLININVTSTYLLDINVRVYINEVTGMFIN